MVRQTVKQTEFLNSFQLCRQVLKMTIPFTKKWYISQKEETKQINVIKYVSSF